MFLRISFVIVMLALGWMLIPKVPRVTLRLQREYDYVIVGTGSAGAVLAARLSANEFLQVAALEAGGDDAEFPQTAIPSKFFGLQNTDVDWAYKTVPQEHACWSLINRKSAWARGRGLGGSSLINGLMVTRGSQYDYDRWEALGNKGWGYSTMLHYLKKLERVTDPELLKSVHYIAGFRGNKGPLTVSEPNTLPVITKAFLEALDTLGHPVTDCNGKDMIGGMAFQGNIKQGVRDSTATAYLKPVMDRPNLHVVIRAHVTKILFEGQHAVGVEYISQGVVQQVFARKEVILSAGVIASPQLLMLSGIGPKEHLNQFKIPVVADLPVGLNLQDHLMTDAVAYSIEKPVTMHPDAFTLKAYLEYKLFGTGLMAGTPRAATAYFRSAIQPDDRLDPAYQLVIDGLLLGADPKQSKLIAKSYNQHQEVFDALHKAEAYTYGVSLSVRLLRPLSVGSIRLASTDPFDHPLIDPQYLSNQRDVDITIEGIRKAYQIMETEAFRKLGAQRQKNIHPNCTQHTYDTDSYWQCYVRSNTLTVYHPVGTCKMGPRGDPTAVVDPTLRVHGIAGLRVVDASVMPDITSGNTLIPVLAIAERAADLILKNSL